MTTNDTIRAAEEEMQAKAFVRDALPKTEKEMTGVILDAILVCYASNLSGNTKVVDVVGAMIAAMATGHVLLAGSPESARSLRGATVGGLSKLIENLADEIGNGGSLRGPLIKRAAHLSCEMATVNRAMKELDPDEQAAKKSADDLIAGLRTRH